MEIATSDISEMASPLNHKGLSQAGSPNRGGPKFPIGLGGPQPMPMSYASQQQELMLKPLPLLDNSIPMQQEPELLKAFKRTQVQARFRRMNEQDNSCPHTKVENWVCQECNNKVSSFGCIFDTFKGKVKTFMKVVYENDFLEDFHSSQALDELSENDGGLSGRGVRQSREDALSEAMNGQPQVADIIYQQYQPSNVTELREYMLFLICKKLKKQFKKTQSPLGPGHVNHLSNKLISYLQELNTLKKKLLMKYNNDILHFDSIFESGNLLQAEIVNPNEYQLYMQVDTNTRGHQQWFYFRVRNTRADKKYTFRIMNFTKQGLTACFTTQANNQNTQGVPGNQGSGGEKGSTSGQPGYQSSPGKRGSADHLQKIHFRSKLNSDTEWRVIDSDQLEFVKTSVQRKRKDILAAAADSDQDDMNEGDLELIDSSQKFLKQKTQKKRKPQYYYALQFEVTFQHSNDSVFFAYALPYTLTDMTEMILLKEAHMQQTSAQDDEIRSNDEDLTTPRDESNNNIASLISAPAQAQAIQGGTPVWQENGVTIEIEAKCLFYKREILARSICGLPLYLITIGKDSKSYRRKPIIIITSRVHAAETPGSYVFDGIFKFLCSNASEAKFLRKFYTFVLVPTLNPDGIVCGNYRSSVSGVDLNRQWIQPDEEYHPEIYAIKQLMKTYYEKERRQLWIYCDLHGHSKKKNSFFYGCNTAANGGFLSWTIVRLLPRIFAQKTHLFNYKDCRFKVEPYKLGTGRVVAWKQFMITHSFTLESSFYGYDFGEDEHKLFTEKEYSDVGVKLCQSIFELHFLWKSIRNELKLTNGWLKPRKLIEITGVPAAQLLSEELQKKKKEEHKKRAIEQYEQFLKKFYNKDDKVGANVTPSTQPRRASKLISMQNTQFKTDQNLNVPLSLFAQQQQRQSAAKGSANLKSQISQPDQQKSRNRELVGANSENVNADIKHTVNTIQEESTDIYKLLEGLVKIQARIRGFLARKRVKTMVPKVNIRVQDQNGRKSQSFKVQVRDHLVDQEQYFLGSRPPVLDESELRKLKQTTIKEKLAQVGSNLPGEELIEGFNWRQYFQEQELEEAYHHVEVEREDDPMDNFSEGSSSNPSQDNFDLQEIYEQIYEARNAQELAMRKEEANNRFLLELSEQEFIDQQAMFHLLDEGFKGRQAMVRHSLNGGLRQRGYTKQKTFKPSDSLYKGGFGILSGTDNQMNRKPSYADSISAQQIVKKSDNVSPAHKQQTNDDNAYHPLTAHQIHDPNRPDKHLSSQSRLQTANRGAANQNFNVGMQNIQSLHFKLLQQSQINGGFSTGVNYYGKKESIQQVIKDCFITKKIGGGAQPTTNSYYSGSTANHPSDAQRVHSLNSHKTNQQNTLQYIKKRSKKNAAGGGQYTHKTPAQKLYEQREQIKQYFNWHQQGMIQPIPGSSNEKYRALIAGNKFTGEYNSTDNNSAIVSGITHIDQTPNMTYYGGPGGFNGGPMPQDSAASSIFMKYVKQKLVKKLKTEQLIPQQVTDKYIDIYKELIDKEAYKKNQEREFLKKHTYLIPQSSMPQNSSSGGNSNSRNKLNSRSEQKQRPKQKNATNTTRKELNQGEAQGHSVKIDDMSFMGTPNVMVVKNIDEKGHNYNSQSAQKPFGNSEVVVRSSVDGETFLHLKQVNTTGMKSSPNKKTNQKIIVTAKTNDGSSMPQISNSENQNIKLPQINMFSATLDYKKKSKDVAKQVQPSERFPDANIHMPASPTTASKSNIPQSFNEFCASFNQPQPKLNDMPINEQASAENNILSEKSIDSSIDDEMLDKIKNIYSEMRKHTHSTYANNQGGQQIQTQQQPSSYSNNTNKKAAGGSNSIRSKRLVQKQQTSEQPSSILVNGSYYNTYSAMNRQQPNVAPQNTLEVNGQNKGGSSMHNNQVQMRNGGGLDQQMQSSSSFHSNGNKVKKQIQNYSLFAQQMRPSEQSQQNPKSFSERK